MKYGQHRDYRGIFLNNVPMMDVRAPAEFLRGAFPTSVNLPLLDDSEREQIGITYKKKGNSAAVELGHLLVHGRTKDQRVSAWRKFASDYPDALLYCFRGGQRSAFVQQWLSEVGVEMPRVEGGYKAMRNFLMHQIDELANCHRITLVGGRTGTGKTELVNAVGNSVDLEGLAHHRGSAFGRRAQEQPTPINFENSLAVDWMKLDALDIRHVVMEDEGKTIGRCGLPEALWAAFQRAEIVLLEDTLDNRIERIRRDYIEVNLADFMAEDPTEGFEQFSSNLLASLDRIRKRLGGKAHQEVQLLMKEALERQLRDGGAAGHNAWIRRLLVDYYDPMYDYQLEQKKDRIVFSGSHGDLAERLPQVSTNLESI